MGKPAQGQGMKRTTLLLFITFLVFCWNGNLGGPVPALGQITDRLQVIVIKGQFLGPEGKTIEEYDYLEPGRKYRLLPKAEVQLSTPDGKHFSVAVGPGLLILDSSGSVLLDGKPLKFKTQEPLLDDVVVTKAPSQYVGGIPFRAIGVVPKKVSLGPGARVLRALIIGIDSFQDNKIRKLNFCRKDAEAMRDLLSDRRYSPSAYVRVHYLLGEEATRERVRTALERLGDRAAPVDTVIVYFASHGIQQDGGQAFWVLHNSKVDRVSYGNEEIRIVPQTALGQPEIHRLLNRIKARRIVVLVDSCFSAATVISYPRGKDFKSPKAKNPFDGFKGAGRVVITASGGTQNAAELPQLGHGAFTYFLLEGLKGKADSNMDNVVELWEIWQYLDKKVTDAARRAGGDQRPTISSVHLTHGFPLTTYPLGDAQMPASLPERPVHVTGKPPVAEWVTINRDAGRPVRISPTEITNRQFLDFVRANPKWRKDRILSQYHDGDYLRHWPGPDAYPKGLDDHPVTYVSWFAAKAFAEWAGGRLPSETEWITAASGAKGGTAQDGGAPTRLYPWGGQWNPALSNHRSGINPGTAPVHAFEQGGSLWPGGVIYNMAGNAWEWCSDWAFEYATPSGTKVSIEEPVGGDKKPALNRLIKGGSFLADRLGCMIPSRVWADPRLCAEDEGFRVVRG